MDTVPTSVINTLAAAGQAIVDWLHRIAAERRLAETNILRGLEEQSTRTPTPEPCFHASCPEPARYFGRCRDHQPVPGRHYCTGCWRDPKAHPNKRACRGHEFRQAAPIQHYQEDD